MPRSPSPPYRPRGNYDPRRDRDRDWDRDRDRDRDRDVDRDRATSSYRGRHYDPDYRGRGRGRGFRGRGRGGYRERDDRRRSYTRSLSRSRSRSRDRRPIERERRYSPAKSRSLTPEEGQITSAPSTRRRSPLPPPPRRGSPIWRRDRDRSIDRDRDRDWRDDRRDTRRPFSRSSRSPPPPRSPLPPRDRERERDYSPASVSSRSLSTRFPSPEKRRVVYSPRPRSPERPPAPALTASVPEPPKRPIPVAVPLHALRVPPSGPRSERFPPTGPAIPSGPRALQHHSQPQHQAQYPNQAPQTSTSTPYAPRIATSNTPIEPGPITPNRLSWAERKTSGFGHGPHEVKEEARDVEMEPDLPVVDEAELEEQRAREEDARITAELPELKMPFARARWEVDLDNHYKRMLVLQHNTDRARSMQRIAGAVLSDAEAELYAATERSKVVEDQLVKAPSLGVGVGLL